MEYLTNNSQSVDIQPKSVESDGYFLSSALATTTPYAITAAQEPVPFVRVVGARGSAVVGDLTAGVWSPLAPFNTIAYVEADLFLGLNSGADARIITINLEAMTSTDVLISPVITTIISLAASAGAPVNLSGTWPYQAGMTIRALISADAITGTPLVEAGASASVIASYLNIKQFS